MKGRSYLRQNVFDAALDRIRRVFREFPQVVVSISGGKDSTVVFNLAMIVARELGRLPLNVFWMDQEAEWQNVVDYIRGIMNHPDVRPYWFQGPFLLSNATSTADDAWLHCWRPGDKWIREQEPNSIHENRTGAERFHKLFGAFSKTYFGGAPCASLSGVRCEESPARLFGLTAMPTYKDITWGSLQNKREQHYVFHPLYDWSWRDVWKSIHANNWKYCRIYDYMFQYGVPVNKMRVSNVHHETSIHSLDILQEIEPDTWNRIVERVGGCAAVGRARDVYKCPDELPFMFATWREYRDYLLENLIEVPRIREKFRKSYATYDRTFIVENPEIEKALMQNCIAGLLVNDYEGVKHDVFAVRHGPWRRTFGVKAGDKYSDRAVAAEAAV